MNDPSHHLALVAAPAQPVRQDDRITDPGAGTVLIEPIFRGRLGAREGDAWADALARFSPRARVPLAIRITADQVLEVAADAEFRAEILNDFATNNAGGAAQRDPTWTSTKSHDRRVIDLREAAADLRKIVAYLVGG